MAIARIKGIKLQDVIYHLKSVNFKSKPTFMFIYIYIYIYIFGYALRISWFIPGPINKTNIKLEFGMDWFW